MLHSRNLIWGGEFAALAFDRRYRNKWYNTSHNQNFRVEGGTVNYLLTQNYDNFGPDLVTLVEQAVAQDFDGIASPVWVPESQVHALKVAGEKGIAITMFNAGQDKMEELGALNYFGSDEYVAGQESGKYLAAKGAKKIMCHIQIPGATNLESRCEGVKDGVQLKPVQKRTSFLYLKATLNFCINFNPDVPILLPKWTFLY